MRPSFNPHQELQALLKEAQAEVAGLRRQLEEADKVAAEEKQGLEQQLSMRQEEVETLRAELKEARRLIQQLETQVSILSYPMRSFLRVLERD